jgi:hypothetical protein
MHHALLASLGVCLLMAVLTSCEKKKTPQASSPQLEKLATVKPPQQPSPIPKVTATTPTGEDRPYMGLESKQKFPALIGSPERLNPVGDRLKAELSGLLPSDPKFGAKLKRIWDDNFSQLSTAPLASTDEEAVAIGSSLPKELFSLIATDVWTDTPAAMLCGVSYMALAARNDLLIEFMSRRANALPPTVADLRVYEALNKAISELSPIRQYSPFEVWEQFAEAKNPLYRLLALRAGMNTTSRAASALSAEDQKFTRIDAPAKLGFYLSFLDETDPLILTEAIRSVATVPVPQAREAIKKFQTAQQQQGNLALVEAAAEALHTQELITQGSR